ncbi:MAG TPA: type-F conjugative transfer system protein TraW [Pedomonas sp.]|uniref:type-F conjugative transfer system protein TraW n=1 Tax=Pedomonas sp. TaxID=2976421 RepID=UPI002F41EC31
MGRALILKPIIAATLLSALALPVQAKDYGQAGAVFPIVEEDFLKVIEARLRAMEKNGALAAANRKLAETVKAQVLDPPAVRGLAPAQGPRSWLFDPGIELQEDIRDAEGRLVAARGTRVNPLDHVGLRQRLVFLDGTDDAQVRWAVTSTAPETVKLILTNGSAFRLMEQHKRRFYFDQAGKLTARFGLSHVPAVIEQEGRQLRIREVPISRQSLGDQP